MKNSRYDYSPGIGRPPIRWPGNARVAVWILLAVEHFDIGLPGFRPREAGSLAPDVRSYSIRDYGLRVGFWRVMDILDKFNVKATVGLNAAVCSRFPVIIKEAHRRGWEFMAHGISNSTTLAGLTEDQEREVIRVSIETIGSATGAHPEGWISPALAETFNTPDILAEEGIKYLSDWCSDDEPFPMKVRKGRMISIPSTMDLNDLPAFLNSGRTPDQFYQMIVDQFDRLYEEGARASKLMAITLHPFLIGRPYCIGCLDKALHYVTSHAGVWLARGSDIADWYYEHYYRSI